MNPPQGLRRTAACSDLQGLLNVQGNPVDRHIHTVSAPKVTDPPPQSPEKSVSEGGLITSNSTACRDHIQQTLDEVVERLRKEMRRSATEPPSFWKTSS